MKIEIKSPEWLEGYQTGMIAAAQIAINQLTADTTVNNAQTCRAIKDKIEAVLVQTLNQGQSI